MLWSYKSNETLNVKLTFKNHDIFREFIGEISYLDLKTGSVNKLNYFKGNIINTNNTTLAKFGGGVCGRCHNGMGNEDNPIELDPVIVIPTDPWWELPDLIPPFTPGVPVTVPSINEALKNKPFAFIDVPCDIIKECLKTASRQVRQAQLNKLKEITKTSTTRGGITTKSVANLQNINNAYSKVVNLDYFPITVNQLPIVGGRRLRLHQFMEHIRKNINSFVNNFYSVFEPYRWNGINDTKLWNSSNPLGAVIGINIAGPDNGSVIVTDYSSSGWTFSTIYDPKYGVHPVSGHRDFGYFRNADGSHTFYTRGVDRLTTRLDDAFPDVAFTAADLLWESFQNKISNYVNSHGGRARVGTPQISRPDWQKVKDVLDGKKPLSTLSNDCK